MDLAEAMLKDVGKANQDWRRDAAEHESFGELPQVDGLARVLVRMDEKVAVLADRKVTFAPPGYVVKFTGVVGGPRVCTV
jgi:hypothetical protein